MWQSVLIQRALPLTLSWMLLIAAAISLDYLLHRADIPWIGRYLGVAGTAFVASSFGYSARKKKIVQKGSVRLFLRLHCNAGWIGTLMIVVHSGIHFNALLPWDGNAVHDDGNGQRAYRAISRKKIEGRGQDKKNGDRHRKRPE